MANYIIDHSCGHQSERQLYGKHSERERKLDYFASQDCPKCWGQEQREIEAAKPITASIKCNGLDTTVDGDILAEVILTGGTYKHKDAIKDNGFFWDVPRGGVMDLLSTSAPRKAWIKRTPLQKLLPSENKKPTPEAKQLVDWIRSLGGKISIDIDPVSIEMIKKRAAKKAETDKIEKPKKPENYPTKWAQFEKGAWNGKIYGRSGSYNLYMAGKRMDISDGFRNAVIKYQTERSDYNAKIREIMDK